MNITTNCTGCRLCENICPKNCIIMKENNEGFLTAEIDSLKCISCGLYVKKCPQNSYTPKTEIQEVYGARVKDNDMIMNSSSGGLFAVFAKYILSKKGVVFGAAYCDDNAVRHICISSENDLYKLQGSKYVQSDTMKTFEECAEYLENSRLVLYSGTPCQIAGLKVYLGKEYNNLFTVDLICHGVPSPKLFKRYLIWLENKYNDTVTGYNFRYKGKAEWGLSYKVELKKKNKFGDSYADPYYSYFLKGVTYRECCYNCKYASEKRTGDVTLGDYWGIEKLHPEFYNEKGVSLVILNTEKGRKLFEEAEKDIIYIKSTMEKAVLYNKNLKRPTERPSGRDNIYDNIDNYDYDYIGKDFKISAKSKIKNKVPYGLKKIIKTLKK